MIDRAEKIAEYAQGFLERGGDLQISASCCNGQSGCTIYLSGALDNDGAYFFRDYANGLSKLLLPGDVLTVDMERLRYIASMGIGVLTILMLDLRRRDNHLVLANIPSPIQDLFRLLGLLSYFDIKKTDRRNAQ